ncbi:hypothetical protein [Mycolicibacterium fortuitum]|uniref:hypothetical protein n=1 Tax=Mycolicibacterium fortuitum TaxID=1766 RepID=UPI0007EA631F|nr:hypothetical protein [Mycolicibacterium fortuitum]OBB37170.1 hypothetical protein A5763_30745 [Mycolicibacterium fortuitum]OBB45370.1 hypothetical protein A5754_10160 [Mycolicibacterium fortuitum]OBB51776.1 hypothetical protein A5755_03680 [Mycolicibacterium fortuitum]OBF77676.1 hypothetical protein A5751_01030 [Mycolicibacterium fortuitum]OBG21101.1 hypothetical protein A5768_27595 [Mycolicibacterium fortuitum]
MSQTASIADRVDRVVQTVTAVDGVIGLHFGPGVPATHLPGRTVRGIRLGADRGEVHVVLQLREHLLDVAEQVQRVASAAAGVPVDVVVGDVAVVEQHDACGD